MCSPYDASPSARGSSDAQCPKDWQVIRVDQNVPGEVTVFINDPRLDDIPVSYNLDTRVIFKDYYNQNAYKVVFASREGSKDFIVRFQDTDVQCPGLFLADLAMYKVQPAQSYNYDSAPADVPVPTDLVDPEKAYPVYVQRMFLEIAPNNTLATTDYPLTISEVRLALRDECPTANYLLDDFEFTDKEIFYAMRKAVDYWNEVPPDVQRYTYANYPYRYHWTLAVIGLLLRQTGRFKLRNWLPYQGGNVSVNDASTWERYHMLGDQYWKEYREFVLTKKVEINALGGFGGTRGRTTGW